MKFEVKEIDLIRKPIESLFFSFRGTQEVHSKDTSLFLIAFQEKIWNYLKVTTFIYTTLTREPHCHNLQLMRRRLCPLPIHRKFIVASYTESGSSPRSSPLLSSIQLCPHSLFLRSHVIVTLCHIWMAGCHRCVLEPRTTQYPTVSALRLHKTVANEDLFKEVLCLFTFWVSASF